jgi:hypothetical protein
MYYFKGKYDQTLFITGTYIVVININIVVLVLAEKD